MSASARSGAVGWRFFLWWMLALLGFPAGGLLAFVLVGSVEGVLSGALAGALAGAVIGAAQWLVLRRYLRVGSEWILATALGVAIGDAIGALLTGAGTGIGSLTHHWPGYRHRGRALAMGAPKRERPAPLVGVGAGGGNSLDGRLDGDLVDRYRRRAGLRRVRLVGGTGLRGDHRRGDAIHTAWPDPLAWDGAPEQNNQGEEKRR